MIYLSISGVQLFRPLFFITLLTVLTLPCRISWFAEGERSVILALLSKRKLLSYLGKGGRSLDEREGTLGAVCFSSKYLKEINTSLGSSILATTKIRSPRFQKKEKSQKRENLQTY